MRVTAHELVANFGDYGVDVEFAVLFSELRLEDNVEEQISQFLGYSIEVLIIDGFEDFIDLLDQHRFERVEVLLLIPWTAVRTTQPRHDLDQSFESLPSGILRHVSDYSCSRRETCASRAAPAESRRLQLDGASDQIALADGVVL